VWQAWTKLVRQDIPCLTTTYQRLHNSSTWRIRARFTARVCQRGDGEGLLPTMCHCTHTHSITTFPYLTSNAEELGSAAGPYYHWTALLLPCGSPARDARRQRLPQNCTPACHASNGLSPVPSSSPCPLHCLALAILLHHSQAGTAPLCLMHCTLFTYFPALSLPLHSTFFWHARSLYTTFFAARLFLPPYQHCPSYFLPTPYIFLAPRPFLLLTFSMDIQPATTAHTHCMATILPHCPSAPHSLPSSLPWVAVRQLPASGHLWWRCCLLFNCNHTIPTMPLPSRRRRPACPPPNELHSGSSRPSPLWTVVTRAVLAWRRPGTAWLPRCPATAGSYAASHATTLKYHSSHGSVLRLTRNAYFAHLTLNMALATHHAWAADNTGSGGDKPWDAFAFKANSGRLSCGCVMGVLFHPRTLQTLRFLTCYLLTGP